MNIMVRSANSLKIEFGVTRYFGNIDIGDQGLVRGWAQPEAAHVWNDGHVAELAVGLTPKDIGLVRRVTFEGLPFVSERHTHQDVTLFANGLFAGFWRLPQSAEPVSLEALLPPHYWLPGPDESKIVFSFLTPDAVSPAELGAAADNRRLAFSLHSILIR